MVECLCNGIRSRTVKGAEQMTEFLFGWLTKPQVMWSIIDEFMACIEIFIAFILFVLIVSYINEFKNRRKKK